MGRIPDFSQPRVKRYRGDLAKLKKRIPALPKVKKGSEDWLEVELLKNELELGRYHWSDRGEYCRNPLLYLNHWIYGIWYLMIRIKDGPTRLKAILKFLFTSESLLYAAQQNLTEVPKLWRNIAESESQAFRAFLKQIHRELTQKYPKRRSEITAALRRGDRVMQDFLGLLKRASGPKGVNGYAVGEKAFKFLLKHGHRSRRNPQQLEKFAWGQIAETKSLLEETAANLDKKLNWRQHLEKGKKDHPSVKNLIKVYQREVRQARGFIKKRGLVTLPKNEYLKVIATPDFSRETLPFAAYINPPMFSGKNQGYFFVTVPKRGALSALEEHNQYSLRVTTVHEAYPGHHLQFARQKTIRSSLGRTFHCPSFYEGWALYCEELMYEQGYYDEITRLNQLRDRLWRACRVVIDVGLHTGQMTDKQAVQLLKKEVGMDADGARGEVNWYTLQPTVPQSYLTGMDHILQLRKKLQKHWGKKFSLKRFHDRLLRHGAIPLSLVEQMLYSSKS